jgi:hypothetical protein
MMTLRQALEWLAIIEVRGPNFHYTTCGIYHQSIITYAKAYNDPTRICTCGRDEAMRIVSTSKVGLSIWAAVGAQKAAAVNYDEGDESP